MLLAGSLPLGWPRFSKLLKLDISNNKLEGQVGLAALMANDLTSHTMYQAHFKLHNL